MYRKCKIYINIIEMDNNEQIARLRVRILFGHVMNKLFKK